MGGEEGGAFSSVSKEQLRVVMFEPSLTCLPSPLDILTLPVRGHLPDQGCGQGGMYLARPGGSGGDPKWQEVNGMAMKVHSQEHARFSWCPQYPKPRAPDMSLTGLQGHESGLRAPEECTTSCSRHWPPRSRHCVSAPAPAGPHPPELWHGCVNALLNTQLIPGSRWKLINSPTGHGWRLPVR